MTQLYDPDLIQWLQNSGEYIGRIRPADERAAWILLLIDEVRAFLTPEEYTELLDELARAIAMRQQTQGRA